MHLMIAAARVGDLFEFHMPRASTVVLAIVGVGAGLVVVWWRRRKKELDKQAADQIDLIGDEDEQ